MRMSRKIFSCLSITRRSSYAIPIRALIASFDIERIDRSRVIGSRLLTGDSTRRNLLPVGNLLSRHFYDRKIKLNDLSIMIKVVFQSF